MRNTPAALKREHPDFTLEQIAEQVGMTKEGVRWHLKREGMPTKRVHRRCANCGAPIFRKDRRFCSSRCRWDSRRVVLACDWCGKRFAKGRWEARAKERKGYKHCFCSRDCFHNYLRR